MPRQLSEPPHSSARRQPPILTAMSRARALVDVVLFGVLPAGVVSVLLASEWQKHSVAPDFRYGLYRQAKDFLASGVPFDPANVVITGENRIYTLVATILATPLTALDAPRIEVHENTRFIGPAS